MPEIHDPMTATLEALRSDVERTPLADSLAVRRRGDQRTRRQAVGGALVVVAMVAGAVGYLTGGLTGDDEGLPPATGGPTASATVEPTYALADNPFMTAEDMSNLGEYQAAGSLVAAGQPETPGDPECTVRPDDWAVTGAEVRGRRYFQGDPAHPKAGASSEASVLEYVVRFGSAERSRATDLATSAALNARLTVGGGADCPEVDPSEGRIETRATEHIPGVEGAWRHSRLFVPTQDSEPSYTEVASAHRGNIVIVLVWRAWGSTEADGAWTFTAEAVQAALDRAVGPLV